MADTIQEFHWPINIPFNENVNWNVLVTNYESGKEQRRKKWSQPKRTFTVSLRGKSKTIEKQISDFYIARSGAFDTFYFQNPNENPITGESFGTGNGTTTQFSLAHTLLPSGDISITKAGDAQTETTHYTLNRATGVVTFLSAPASGDALIAQSYNFCRKVRFAEKPFENELFNFELYNNEITLIEVL